MPRQGAGPRHPKLGRAVESLIAEIDRDCSDEELGALMRKIRRLTARSVSKALRSGGCDQIGPVIPPPGLIGSQTAATAAKAIETLYAIHARRIDNAAKVGALFEAMYPAEKSEAEAEAPVFRIELSTPDRPKPEPDE